jgi:hypothetical protein
MPLGERKLKAPCRPAAAYRKQLAAEAHRRSGGKCFAAPRGVLLGFGSRSSLE